MLTIVIVCDRCKRRSDFLNPPVRIARRRLRKKWWRMITSDSSEVVVDLCPDCAEERAYRILKKRLKRAGRKVYPAAVKE
jgi:hypothetical protein